jgi:glycosyltransferase involved in cell wall biosynthesis
MFERQKPVEFVVLVPSYNNEKWVVQNLESIANQTYPHWSMYYINDCSSDRTGQIVDEFVKLRGIEHKCKVVHNTTRKLAMTNLYEGIHNIDPTKVVVICDGDDWFANNSVLERLAKTYSNKKIWMTYGNYQTWPEDRGSTCDLIPDKVRKNQLFRSYRWVSSHLRTFYAKLFQQIKKEDFIWKGEGFFPMTYDLAIMFPMLEMASKKHYRFITDVLYIYNISNPLNDFKVNLQLQEEIERYIRSRQPYEPLKSLF